MGFKDSTKERFEIYKSKINNIKIGKKINQFIAWKYSKAIMVFVLVAIIFSGFAYGDITTKESELIKKVSIALNSGSEKKLLKIIKVENKNIKLSKDDLKPLIRFYEEDKSRVSTLVTSLKNGDEAYSLKVVKEEGFIRDKYFLGITLREVEIVSNFKNSKLYLDSKYKGDIGSSGRLILSGMVPGVYDIKVENKSIYSELLEERKIAFTQNDKVDIELNGIMVTVSSNFANGIVYINGESSGKAAKDFVNIGPFLNDGSVELQVKAETPWGELSSNKVYIDKLPEVNIDIDLKNEGIIKEIDNTVSEFYSSVFTALNSQNKEDIVDASDEVKNQVYDVLNKKYFLFKNKYEISDLDIKMENSEVSYSEGEYIGNIVVNVSYAVKKNILGIDIKRDTYDEDFFTKVKYTDGKWTIYELDNFSIAGITKTLSK